jgi:hypothetical protein
LSESSSSADAVGRAFCEKVALFARIFWTALIGVRSRLPAQT